MAGELKPFSIGGIKIDLPFVLAGMAGYTDAVYRMICRRHGAPYCTTEMMLDKSLLTGGKVPQRMVTLGGADHPVAGQIIGGQADTMAAAAQMLCKTGFDVIDLNFACPVNKALRRRRGGYLMSQPGRAVAIIRAVMAATDRPVTLKLRRRFGRDDSDDAFWRIAQAAFEAGVSAVAVHARSVEAKFTGSADWEFLREVKHRFPDRTILASGDVHTPQAALEALWRTGADAVLVARGALGNPWFFRQVRELAAGRQPQKPALAEQRELLLRHFEDACKLYGADRGPRVMRKFGARYARLHPHPRTVRKAFVAVERPQDWRDVVETFYPN